LDPKAQEFFKKHVNPKINKKELSVTSPMQQTLDKNGKVLHEERYTQQMISWDLVYFVLRACFDGLESEYCSVPERQEGEGETKYEVGRKVVGVRDLGKEGVEVECEVLTEAGREVTERHESEKDNLRGDLVIAADGPSSTIRKIVCSEIERTYAGYVAWRRTVPENEASETMKRTFVDRFTFFHDFDKGIQILACVNPLKYFRS
jgi:2-polyprenyl-6-methoxyphenol hydroxylase-like FAD-dependent oxidoreductase